MSGVLATSEPDFDLLEIDPRPCELCGLTSDRHDMVDDGEGPQFYCPDLSPDEMTLDELERRAELRRQEEVAAILARMDAMDVPFNPTAPREPLPYRTPEATVNAFWYVVRLGDPEYLTRWLSQHPLDAPHLYRLWEAKCLTVAV
jgi:hypothetical protein